MASPVLVSLIVFGGGWGAEGTQASIETHVLALKSAFAQKQLEVVLFASGDPNVRDVQINDDQEREASALLGMIFDRRDHLAVDYRTAQIPGARPASKRTLIDAIASAANNTHGTAVFGAGHGTPESKEERAAIELFGVDQSLKVDALASALDLMKRSGPLAFVLGHCHSGAFADISHRNADPKDRLAEPARCVLAAVPADRQAAGCSADVADPSARAYMALIAEAFTQPSADADKNGRISLAEAHTHARIYDRTIDLPVTSSEMFLARSLGKLPAPSTIALNRLLPNARVTEKRVLLELRPEKNSTPASVSHTIDQHLAILERLDDELDALDEAYEATRRKLLDELLRHYPELANPYHAESRRLLAGDAPELVAFLKSKRELLELDARQAAITTKEIERFELEKKNARLERWMRAAVTVAAEAQLRKQKKREAKLFDQLVACEALEP